MTQPHRPEDPTTAHEQSLRPPGRSLPATDDAADDDFFDTDTTDEERLHAEQVRRAGYDPADAGGDTEAVRPQ